MMMAVFDAVVVAIAVASGFQVHWLGLAALAVLLGLLAALMAAFSTATALVTKEISSFAAIINGINLPILLLAGVLLPISFGPLWMRVVAHFNPLYYAVQASRSLADGGFRRGGGMARIRRPRSVVRPRCVLGDPGVPKGCRLGVFP